MRWLIHGVSMRCLVPSMVVLCMGTILPCAQAAEPAPPDGPEVRALPPPVHGLDDFTLLDDRLWTAAVSRRPQLISRAPAAVEVLTDQDLRRSAAINWADRMRYVAGVDVYQGRHNQYDVGLRGYNSLVNQHLIILVDGREFGRSVTGEQYGHWSGFLFSSDIERVELVKGPSSVTYGANAFGGVISFTGRKVGDRPEAHLHTHVGAYAKREIDGTVLAPLQGLTPALGRWDLKVSAGYTESEPRPSVNHPDPIESHPRLGDTKGYDLRSNRQRAIIGYRLEEDYRIEAEYSGKQMRDQALISDLTGVASQGEFEEHGGGLRFTAPWGSISHWRQQSRASWSSMYVRYHPFRIFAPEDERRGDFYYNQAGFKDRRHVTEADFALDLGDHRLGFGGNYIRWSSTSNIWSRDATFADRDSWVTVNNTTWGVFIEDQWTLSREWFVTAGIRFDSDSRVGDNWSPRASLNWVIDEDQFIRLSYSRGYRIPTLIESYIDIYYFDSDPDLQAEIINAIEIGYQRQFDERRGRLNANISYSRAERLVDWEPRSPDEMQAAWVDWFTGAFVAESMGEIYSRTPGPFFDYTNSDNPITVWGVELGASYRLPEFFLGDLEIMGNGTWQRMRYRRSPRYVSEGFLFTPDPSVDPERYFAFDDTLPRNINAPPEWKFNLAADWEYRQFHAGLAGRYVSSRLIYSFGNTYWLALPDEEEVWPHDRDLAVQRVDDYLAFDLHLGWRPRMHSSQLHLRAGVMDVFNASRYEHYQRSPAQMIEDDASTYSSQVGRNWFIAGDWEW
ncbi:MAG: hypothetical protein EA402_09535 [Planctomycetota bacterium]|nr:MAG: hypothetical protein EA402_09535 [Planctomycetota bacterium]